MLMEGIKQMNRVLSVSVSWAGPSGHEPLHAPLAAEVEVVQPCNHVNSS